MMANATLETVRVPPGLHPVTLATLKAFHAAGLSIQIIRKMNGGVWVRVGGPR